MNRRRPNPQALQAECDRFNNRNPVGSRVLVKVEGREDPIQTCTTSHAEVLSGHSAVVWVAGIAGCRRLSDGTSVEGAA